MKIAEGEQVNPSQLLVQTAARVILYLSNRKAIDQFFVKTVLENKDNLHKIVCRVKRGLQVSKESRGYLIFCDTFGIKIFLCTFSRKKYQKLFASESRAIFVRSLIG